MSKVSDIDWAIFKICDLYRINRSLERTVIELGQVLVMAGVNGENLDLEKLEDRIRASDLFDVADWGSKDGPAIAIKLKPGSSEVLSRYRGYLNYVKRIKLPVAEIVDLVFEELKQGAPAVNLGAFMADKLIEQDNQLIYKVRALLQSSKLADVSEINTDSYTDAIVRINGKGLEELENKKYSEYKSELKSKKDIPSQSIHIGGNVTGSAIGQGYDLDLNNRSPIIKNSPQAAQPQAAPQKKSDHMIWDKIKYISVVIGGVAGIGYLFKEIGKVLGWW